MNYFQKQKKLDDFLLDMKTKGYEPCRCTDIYENKEHIMHVYNSGFKKLGSYMYDIYIYCNKNILK